MATAALHGNINLGAYHSAETSRSHGVEVIWEKKEGERSELKVRFTACASSLIISIIYSFAAQLLVDTESTEPRLEL